MTTTTVTNGQSVTGQTVTSGNEIEVLSGGSATSTTVTSGGTQQIDAGGNEVGSTIRAGGLETENGSATGDVDYGTINLNGTGSSSTATISSSTVESGGTLNLTLKGALATNTTVLAGGALTINGNAAANGTSLMGGTLELESPKADSVNATGTSASGQLSFAPAAPGLSTGRLQLDVAQTGTNGTTFAQTIYGFAAGDVIDVVNISGGTLTETANGANTNVTVTGTGGSETFTFVGATLPSLGTAPDPGTAATAMPAGGTDIVVVCFCTGTRIRTARGGVVRDVAVEDLVVGDLAVTASGACRPIRWIGHRDIDCATHPTPFEAWPVRVRAGAFEIGAYAAALPERDLYLSPGHPVLIGGDADHGGGALVPIMCLVNGTTVARMPTDRVTYWHVELDAHDILLAEGLPAESFLDYGNRAWFGAEADAHALANPDFIVPGLAARCRPVAVDGPIVESERRRLDATFAAGLAAACVWPTHESWAVAQG